jgi:hypothetical protein
LKHLVWLVVGGIALGAQPSQAQLEPIGAPKGVVRFTLSGDWTSYNTRFLDGNEEDYLADFSRPALGSSFWPDLITADTAIGAIIGNSAYQINLGKQVANGGVTVTTAGFNFAVGLTRGLTLFTNIPIVTTRVQAHFQLDSTTANAGFNPALGAGQPAAQQFFTDFQQALTNLQANINNGVYGPPGSPLRNHADAVNQQASLLRDRLFTVSLDPVNASPFMPVDTSTAGVAILGSISDLQDTLSNAAGLNVQGFTSTIPLPTGRLSANDINAFVSDPLGPVQGFPLREAMLSQVGDVEIGAAYTLVNDWDGKKGLGGVRVVAQGSVILPTGKAEDPLNFLDLGTGNKRYEVHGGLTTDLGYGRIGARLIGNYQRRFSSDRALRVTPPEQPIPFANRSSRVTLDPGDLYSLTAQPFFRLAPQLAITAGVSYWHEAEGSASYLQSSDVIPGISAGLLAQESARSATTFTAGLTYVGRAAQECKNGKCGLPIDATLTYERVLSATGGRVPGAETVRGGIRFYRRFW